MFGSISFSMLVLASVSLRIFLVPSPALRAVLPCCKFPAVVGALLVSVLLRECVCVSVCVCARACVRACARVLALWRANMSVCVSICICMYVCVCVCVCVCVYIHKSKSYVCMHTYRHMHTFISFISRSDLSPSSSCPLAVPSPAKKVKDLDSFPDKADARSHTLLQISCYTHTHTHTHTHVYPHTHTQR